MLRLYLDASALLKLLLREEGSETAARLGDDAGELVSASLVYVEARAALARAAGHRRLPRSRALRARSELDALWEETLVIGLDSEVLAAAGEITDVYRLRAADAIHLASALTLGDPDLVFATWDAELGRAARESGLAVAP